MRPRVRHPHLLRRIASLTVGAKPGLFIGACPEPARTSGGADAAADHLVQREAHAADVTKQGGDGATPLHEFVMHRSSAETIEPLLAMGADPNAVDDEGQMPLDVANEEYWFVLRRDMGAPKSD